MVVLDLSCVNKILIDKNLDGLLYKNHLYFSYSKYHKNLDCNVNYQWSIYRYVWAYKDYSFPDYIYYYTNFESRIDVRNIIEKYIIKKVLPNNIVLIQMNLTPIFEYEGIINIDKLLKEEL